MITPAYQNAKKANELVSDVSTGRVMGSGDMGMLGAALTAPWGYGNAGGYSYCSMGIRECWGLLLPVATLRHLLESSESRIC